MAARRQRPLLSHSSGGQLKCVPHSLSVGPQTHRHLQSESDPNPCPLTGAFLPFLHTLPEIAPRVDSCPHLRVSGSTLGDALPKRRHVCTLFGGGTAGSHSGPPFAQLPESGCTYHPHISRLPDAELPGSMISERSPRGSPLDSRL